VLRLLMSVTRDIASSALISFTQLTESRQTRREAGTQSHRSADTSEDSGVAGNTQQFCSCRFRLSQIFPRSSDFLHSLILAVSAAACATAFHSMQACALITKPESFLPDGLHVQSVGLRRLRTDTEQLPDDNRGGKRRTERVVTFHRRSVRH
jgi:hypothetical protein